VDNVYENKNKTGVCTFGREARRESGGRTISGDRKRGGKRGEAE